MISKDNKLSTLTLEDENYIVTITDKSGDGSIDTKIEMMRGALLALTYSTELVDQYIPATY